MILVINLGLKSIRAILFDQHGRKVATAARPVQTLLDGVRVEQEPGEWWRLAAEVCREAAPDKTLLRRIQAVTVTGSSSCLIPADAALQPLGPAIMVSDNRDIDERAVLDAEGLDSRLYPMLSRAMWLRHNGNGQWEQARWMISVNSFMVAQLTGRACTDELNAEKTGWDSDAQAWNTRALEIAGIPASMLPDVLPVGSCVGPLTRGALQHLGLPADQQIFCHLSSYDAICALFGSGVSGEGEAADVSGTVTSLRAVSRTKPAGGDGSIFIQRERSNGLYIVGGSNNLGGGIIEWARQSFYAQETHPYELMTTEAESCPPGAEGLLFLPYLLGERAPLWDSNLRGVFFGMERHHTRRHFIRAIFESTALGLVSLKEAVEKQVGPIRSITASGGMARIPLINNIKADVLGTEIRVLDEFESTALGAWLLCAVARGLYPDLAAARHVVELRQVVVPNARRAAIYREISAFSKDLLAGMQPFFTRRREHLLPMLPQDVSVVGNL